MYEESIYIVLQMKGSSIALINKSWSIAAGWLFSLLEFAVRARDPPIQLLRLSNSSFLVAKTD